MFCCNEDVELLVFSLDTGLLNLALTSSIKCILVCSESVALSEKTLLHMVQLNIKFGDAGTGVMVVVAVDRPVGVGGGNNKVVLIVVAPGVLGAAISGAMTVDALGGGVTLLPSRK